MGNEGKIFSKKIDFDVEKKYKCNLPYGERLIQYYKIYSFFGNLTLDSYLICGSSYVKNLNDRIAGKNWDEIQDRKNIHSKSGMLSITNNYLLCIYKKQCYKIPLESIIWHVKGDEITQNGILDSIPSVVFNVLLIDNSIKTFGFNVYGTPDDEYFIVDEIIADLKSKRNEIFNKIQNDSLNSKFEENTLTKKSEIISGKDIPNMEETVSTNTAYVRINPEYKRTCLICGKIWYSSVAQEKDIKSRSRMDGIQSALNSILDHSATAQYQKNLQDGKNSLTSLRSCPDCHSQNYTEEIIEFAPTKKSDESEIDKENHLDQTQTIAEENPDKLLKIRLAKGEITIDEFKELKELLS